MLSDEGVKKVRLEMRECVHGLGFATGTIVLASLDAAIANHSTTEHVSSDMVRRRDLEEMFNKIKVLEGKLAERDREIAELRKAASKSAPEPKQKPSKSSFTKSKGAD